MGKIVGSKSINAVVLHCALTLLFIFNSHYTGMAQTETPVGQLIKGLENKDSGAREQTAQASVQMGCSSVPELIKAQLLVSSILEIKLIQFSQNPDKPVFKVVCVP